MRRNIFFIILVLVLISCVKNPSNPKDLPESPSDLALTQLDTERILFNWQDNSDNEGGFIVDRKIGSDNWNINYKTFTENTVLFIDSHLTVFDLYSYRLHAYNDDGDSDSLECNLNFLDLDSLNIPSNLALHQLGENTIELNWQDNSTGEEGFRIDRKIGNNDWEENYYQTEENCTIFINSDLTVFDEYFYRVMCFSGDIYSNFVEESILFVDYDSLSAPSNLLLQQWNSNTISLTWLDNSSQEEGFRIDRKIGDNDWEENYAQTDENIESFLILILLFMMNINIR